MAVTVDSVGPSSAGAGNATGAALAWTHTTVAASTYLIAGFCEDAIATNNGASNLAAPTCNGVAMTFLGAEDCGAATGNGSLQVFGIALSSAGAQSVSIPALSSQAKDTEGGSIALAGYASLGAVVKAQSTSITASVAVSSTTSGNLCVGFCAAGDTIASTTSPSTSGFVINEMGGTGDAGGNAAGATSLSTGSAVTMSWGLTSSGDSWAVIAVEVQGPAGTNTSPAYATSYDTTAVSGTGTWVNPGNAEGTGGSGGPWATWTAP